MTRRFLVYLVVAVVLLGAVAWPASGSIWAQDEEPTEEEAQETEEAADRRATRRAEQTEEAEAAGDDAEPAEGEEGADEGAEADFASPDASDPEVPVEAGASEVPPTVIPSATPTAYPLRSLSFSLLSQADVSVTTSGPVVVSAATVVVQPGVTTVAFTTDGETIIAPSIGAVVIDADQGVLGVADIGSAIGLDTVSGTPGPLGAVTVGVGTQVHLAAGATVTIRNDGSAPATLLIVTIVPAA